MEDEWALQAAFAGSICQQVGLHLLQAGQHRATGTAHRKTQMWAKAGDVSQHKYSPFVTFMCCSTDLHFPKWGFEKHSIFLDWSSWTGLYFCIKLNIFMWKYYKGLMLPLLSYSWQYGKDSKTKALWNAPLSDVQIIFLGWLAAPWGRFYRLATMKSNSKILHLHSATSQRNYLNHHPSELKKKNENIISAYEEGWACNILAVDSDQTISFWIKSLV